MSAPNDEPWDELMGPSHEVLAKILGQKTDDKPLEPQAPVLRSQSASTPPPSAVFNKMPDRWAQHETEAARDSNAATARAVVAAAEKAALRESLSASGSAISLPIEDELGDGSRSYRSEDPEGHDAESIRQDALRMLEVADDRLGGSTYGNTSKNKKRTPAALSALSFKANRKNVGRSYRDDPFASTEAPTTREDYEYGDDTVVDVVGMEQRFASSRPAEEGKPKSWSDRYSVDQTLLAMSGGSVSSNNKYLDQIDKENERERRSARNLFSNAPSETRSPKIFGSGFSFRQKNVFGKQDVTAKSNLRTVWMDVDQGSLPPASPAKSWQEQLQQKRRQRRRCLMATLGVLCLVVVLSVLLTNNNDESIKGLTAQFTKEEGSVTFYVTSDMPYGPNDEKQLLKDLEQFSVKTEFLVHLGNIQDVKIDGCIEPRYADVAGILKKSPVPAFMVPGEEDWNDCPNPDQAWANWKKHFMKFESHFDYDFNVFHQLNREENFAFVKDDVLFIGVHVVDGVIGDWNEFAARNEENVKWVKDNVDQLADAVRAIVVFGNARPGGPANELFFNRFAVMMEATQKPVIYVHGNNGFGGLLHYRPFEDIMNIWAVQTTPGNSRSPLRLNVGFGERPLVIG